MDLSSFLTWAESRGIELSPCTEVGTSLLGGLGIFAKSPIEEDEVVLRVPKNSVFDLKNLFEFSEKLKMNEDSKNSSTILNAALQTGGHSSETIIIRSFLWGLAMLRNKTGSLQEIDAYLNVLLTTPTLDIDESQELQDSQDSPDSLIQALVSEKQSVKRDYLKLVEEYSETEALMTFQQAFQLHQAVKSRVLEIPQAENGSDEYEYSTNITLVPVLDFANHSRANNAVFDVDPESNDVILRVIKQVAAHEEITISYDPENSVNKFLKTYGFIPDGPCTFKLDVTEEIGTIIEGKKEDYIKIAKWLQVVPEIPVLIDEKGNVSLDSENFRLPLLMISDLTYYSNWSQERSDIAEEFEVSTGEEVEEIITEIIRQEKSLTLVVASDTAFGVTWHDSYISVSNILEQTGVNSEHEIQMLASRTLESLRRWIASRPTLPKSGPRVSGPFAQYHKLQTDVISQLMEISEEKLLSDIKVSIQNLLQ